MMAAEGHFGNSMARRQVLYLQIDAAVLVKFNDQIVTIMNRLRFNGKTRNSGLTSFTGGYNLYDIKLIPRSQHYAW